MSVSPTTSSITVGSTQQLTATIAPSNATNQTVSWSSSNSGVATVDSNGLVTAVAVGNATITVATADGGKTATSAVTVTAPVVQPSIFVAGYLSAMVNSSQVITASYWKDGVRTDLQGMSAGDFAQAAAIALSGSDVYVVGVLIITSPSTKFFPGYWKNGVRADLFVPTGSQGLGYAVIFN